MTFGVSKKKTQQQQEKTNRIWMLGLKGENKMKLLILLQVLIGTVKICHADNRTETSADSIAFQPDQIIGEEIKKPNSELFDSLHEIEGDGNNLDFDYDDMEDSLKAGGSLDMKEQEMQEVLLKAMKKPAIRKQIGEVIPILRVMSPAQRLTLAAMVSSQIMSQNTLSEENLTEIAAMFANKNIESKDDRHNITEQLLLPISMDIAKMFKGLGKEMGRNLRENFYKAPNVRGSDTIVRRATRKPNVRKQNVLNRRMDEFDYEEPEEVSSAPKPVAEALKQPGKDECDFFTKSLCLEVSNYPTEAIILSLKMNQDIAKTFLTDFEVQPTEERRSHENRKRVERRQDGQNEVQDFSPEGGYMCPSSVKYARPKRARTTSGQWKYIVNAGDYTQTLRLEICQKPKSPCSYVTNHLNSQCAQIYNYHRLLTWDEGKGLHMDIFKVPSCCSCHIQGYSTFFPPNQDFTFAEKRREPSEGTYSLPEQQNRPPYGYIGNKREVPKNFPPGSVQQSNAQNHSLLLLSKKEFFRNPVDHLVPPGPPLPLENEGVGNSYLESKISQKKISLESNRRYPVQAEYRRIINKVSEETESLKELNKLPKNRLKAPASTPERGNVKFSKTHYSEIASGMPEEDNPIYDSTNQNQFSKPSTNIPFQFPNLDVKREKPTNGMFITAKPDSVLQLGPKVNSKPPVKYFQPEFPDSKGVPSKINPLYVTPPKVNLVTRLSTTTKAPQKDEFTASGQKKINYNYHPIIDFFLPDTKKRQSTFSSPQYLPLPSQDWTPVVGH